MCKRSLLATREVQQSKPKPATAKSSTEETKEQIWATPRSSTV
jgi:hypothetical protein